MRLLLLTSLALCCFACDDDSEQVLTDLQGSWEVTTAYRDRTETESLRGLYFNFGADDRLITNLTGAEETYTYEVDGQQITQRMGPLDADYTIEKLLADTLVLKTELRKKQFELILTRQMEE